jgi:hypothetical protein
MGQRVLMICGGSALAEEPFARRHDPVGDRDRSFRPRPNQGPRSRPAEDYRQGASEWQDTGYRSSVRDELLSNERMYTVAAACGATVFAASVATADPPCWWALPTALGMGLLISPPLRRVVRDAANDVMSRYMDSAYRQRTREGERAGKRRARARWDDVTGYEGDQEDDYGGGSVGGGPLYLPAPREVVATNGTSGGERQPMEGRLGVSLHRRDQQQPPLLRFLLSILPFTRWWGGFL